MDATLEKTLVCCWREAAKGDISREETAETVVPDMLPDIAEIIDADGVVLIRGKEVLNGAVGITAEILATVLFRPEGERGLCKLNMKIPWNCRLESDKVNEKCVPMASLTLVSVDAHMLNPRKVLVRAEVSAAVSCWQQSQMEIPLGVTSEMPVETLRESAAITPVTAVREKTFAVVDEYIVPSSLPPIGSILKYNVDLQVEDVKSVGSKLVFKGSARTEILYTGAEENAPVSTAFRTAFSQIMEMEVPCENAPSEVTLLLTGAYIEQLSPSEQCRGIKAELHLAAQAVLRQEMDLEYICDAYCNRTEADVEVGCISAEHLERHAEMRETVRELMETSSPIREVISISASVPQAIPQENAVACKVCVRVIYRDEEGNISSVCRSYAVDSPLQSLPNMEVRVLSAACPEALASPVSGGVEIRVPVDIRVALTETRELRTVLAIRLADEMSIRDSRPSLVIRRAAQGETLWSLAKRGGSTMECIRRVNALEDESITPGRVLLIPKVR